MNPATAAAQGPELRDIHLPPAPSWWPPAPGWWILAALIVAAIFFAARWLIRRRRERLWRQLIHVELDRIAATYAERSDPVQLSTEVSQLLRRAARLIEPQAAALRDEAWLKFLDERIDASSDAPDASPFLHGSGRLLIDAPYRRAADPATQAIDGRALIDLTRRWLRAALPRGRDRA